MNRVQAAFTVILLLIFAGSLSAQELENPRGDLFVGMSLERPGSDVLLGGKLSIALNVDAHARFAVVAESDAFTKTLNAASFLTVVNASGLNLSYHAGPRFYIRNPSSITPFVQILGGIAHSSISATAANILSGANATLSDSDTSPEAIAGAGVDVALSPHMHIRVAELNYSVAGNQTLFGQSTGQTRQFRFSTGFVFRF